MPGGPNADLPAALRAPRRSQIYGMLGILIAPVVVAILIALVEIYRERPAELEPGGTSPEAG